MIKAVKRIYVSFQNDPIDETKQAYFLAVGRWCDGHTAYSRLNENMEIIPEEDGCYYQVREDGKLLMVRA